MQIRWSKMISILTLLVFVLMVLIFGVSSLPFLVPLVFAHCDTMKGPVIQAARKALETGDVNLVLIWVQKKDEAEVRTAFEKALAIRKLNPKAKELADRYFFETLVRIHRAGEGAPYTGLKDEEPSPIVKAADKSIEVGSVDKLAKEVSELATGGIEKRFKEVMARKKHAGESVKAGREYVKAYIEFVHYVENLHLATEGTGAHHEE